MYVAYATGARIRACIYLYTVMVPGIELVATYT